MDGRGSGAGGLKGTYTSLPISLSCAWTTCLIVERVHRVSGSAVGSRWIPTLKYPYNPKDAHTHFPRLSASEQGAQKGTFFISSVL